MIPVAVIPVTASGIYAYVVASPGADRSKPRLNPFSREHANMIRMLNGEGQFDYLPVDTMKSEYGAPFPVFRKGENNPIGGQNDFQFIRYDFDGDQQIKIGMKHGNKDGGGREEMDVWFEELEGEGKYSLNCTGDLMDAFTSGDVIGKSGIVPAMNYPSFHRTPQQFDPIVLNGIRIEVLGQKRNGEFVLEIHFDDWTLTQSTRWCGNLLMPAVSEFDEIPPLTLANRTSLTLDLSGTPSREYAHPETKTCVNPTILSVEAGRSIRLLKGSQMIVEQHSQLLLHPDAQITIEKGASLIIRNHGILQSQAGARIIVKQGGQLMIEESGIAEIADESTLQFATGAEVKGL